MTEDNHSVLETDPGGEGMAQWPRHETLDSYTQHLKRRGREGGKEEERERQTDRQTDIGRNRQIHVIVHGNNYSYL